MRRYFENCIDNSNVPMRCPESTCNCEATNKDIKKLLSQAMVEKYE